MPLAKFPGLTGAYRRAGSISSLLTTLQTTVNTLGANVTSLLSRMTSAENRITALEAQPKTQTVVGTTNASGIVTVTWPNTYAGVPTPIEPVILTIDANTYVADLQAISATGCSYQVWRHRTLPASILTLLALAGYSTLEAAPAGVQLAVSARL